MNVQVRIAVALFAAIGLVSLPACSSSDEWTAKRLKVYKAGGTVLLDGKPCPEAVVTFFSDTNSVSATGRTNAEGKFQLTTYNDGDGAVEGAHKATVVKREFVEEKTKYDSANERSVALIPKELLPKKYMTPSTSGLSYTVATSGANDFKIEISSK
ncbi:MAG: hypothetical protein SFV81_24825 [Pirellulaceae bacterium]|nr:hypothetical protein [Pirellulaceae bacterium]